MRLPDLPGGVFTDADAERRGATRRQLEWAVSQGRLRRLRPGVLCGAEAWTAASAAGRAEFRARAVLLSTVSAGSRAISHGTAAAVMGLPVPERLAQQVWLTVPPGGGARTRRTAGIVRQVAPLPDEDVTVVRGLPCTSPSRTVADCLRHLPARDAMAVGDAALRARLVTTQEVARTLQRCRWPRAAAASALLPLLDGRRESPLESRSAVVMHVHGVPEPAVQVTILDEVGGFVGRVDFAWLDRGVVGEADGLAKYTGTRSDRLVADERERQARLQALGLVVVRWTARQLHGDPPLLVQQLRAALEDDGGRRFRGRVR